MPDLNSPDLMVLEVGSNPQTIEAEMAENLDVLVGKCLRVSSGLEDFCENILDKVDTFTGQYPEKDRRDIQRHILLYVNLFLLDKKILDPRDEKILTEEARANPEKRMPFNYLKEDNARIQQQLTHSIIHACSVRAEPSYIEDTYALASNTSRRIHALEDRMVSNLSARWAGIRNQVAIVRSLLDGGYRVFLPDYNQDPLDTKEEDNAVLQLDVISGVDLIAVSPEGDIILINAKGIRGSSGAEGAVLEDTKQIYLDSEPRQCIRRAVREVEECCRTGSFDHVYQTTLFIPTEGQSFYPTPFVGEEPPILEGKQKELKCFGRLREHISDAIIFEVGRIRHQHQYSKYGS